MDYKKQFETLLKNGVPASFIRKEVLTGLIYFSRVYIYKSRKSQEWYATNGIGVFSEPQFIDSEYKGMLKGMGYFPKFEDYSLLFNGEYNNKRDYEVDYQNHRKEWLEERAKESKMSY